MAADYIGPNDEEKKEKLDNDFETPFSPPGDMSTSMPSDYPTTDTDMDETEWYNDGSSAAASTVFPGRPKKSRIPKGFFWQ